MARYEVKITTKQSQLALRDKPSKPNGRLIKWLNKGVTGIVNEVWSGGGWIWYKWESPSAYAGKWSCAQEPNISYRYITITKDLTPKPSPPPPPPPPKPAPPPPPPIDYDALKDLLTSDGRLPPYDTQFNGVLSGGSDRAEHNSSLEPFKDVVPDSFETNYGFIDKNLKILKSNLNLNYFSTFKELNNKYFNSFNRFKVKFPDYDLSKSFAYVFFTRPDLNLVNDTCDALADQVKNDPYFKDIWGTNRNVIKSLTKGVNSQHSFHEFLSNTCTSFEVSDEVIKTEEVGTNFLGFKIMYGMNNHDSITAGTFNITYEDDRELTIYKINKCWTEYISQVSKGIIEPKREYKLSRILDYASSAYYFLCAEDGETIIYGHKYVGVFPTNAPASVTSWTKGNLMSKPEVTIQYAYSFRESINLLMMAEFNLQSSSMAKRMLPIYDKSLGSTGNAFAGAPYIQVLQDGLGNVQYKLRHRPNYL